MTYNTSIQISVIKKCHRKKQIVSSYYSFPGQSVKPASEVVMGKGDNSYRYKLQLAVSVNHYDLLKFLLLVPTTRITYHTVNTVYTFTQSMCSLPQFSLSAFYTSSFLKCMLFHLPFLYIFYLTHHIKYFSDFFKQLFFSLLPLCLPAWSHCKQCY